jgi:hypothetical protein
MRRIVREKARRIRVRPQREVLRDVMLSAGECEAWLTLDELAKLTRYPQASISAQLRHLRKPEYGAFVVEKRCREVDEVVRQDPHGAVWEYRLRRGVRVVAGRKPARRGSAVQAMCRSN